MRAILTWHSIDGSGSPISVSTREWRAQVAWLVASGVPVVSLEELLTRPDGDRAVAITFDDGFANFATEALPVLADHGFPVTLFVVSGHVGGDNRWPGRSSTVVPRLPLLDWDALGRLPEELVTVGAHTRSHPHLDRIADEAVLDAELGGSAEAIAERLGRRPAIVAYPYGGLSAAAVRVAARHFRWGCTTDLRPLGPVEEPLLLPRIDVHYLRTPWRLGHWGSRRLRGWLRLRRGGRQLRGLLPQGLAA